MRVDNGIPNFRSKIWFKNSDGVICEKESRNVYDSIKMTIKLASGVMTEKSLLRILEAEVKKLSVNKEGSHHE